MSGINCFSVEVYFLRTLEANQFFSEFCFPINVGKSYQIWWLYHEHLESSDGWNQRGHSLFPRCQWMGETSAGTPCFPGVSGWMKPARALPVRPVSVDGWNQRGNSLFPRCQWMGETSAGTPCSPGVSGWVRPARELPVPPVSVDGWNQRGHSLFPRRQWMGLNHKAVAFEETFWQQSIIKSGTGFVLYKIPLNSGSFAQCFGKVADNSECENSTNYFR